MRWWARSGLRTARMRRPRRPRPRARRWPAGSACASTVLAAGRDRACAHGRFSGRAPTHRTGDWCAAESFPRSRGRLENRLLAILRHACAALGAKRRSVCYARSALRTVHGFPLRLLDWRQRISASPPHHQPLLVVNPHFCQMRSASASVLHHVRNAWASCELAAVVVTAAGYVECVYVPDGTVPTIFTPPYK